MCAYTLANTSQQEWYLAEFANSRWLANNIAKWHKLKKLSEFKKKGRINITNITEKYVAYNEIYLCALEF